MKKIMLAAAVIGSAIMAQAAATNWKVAAANVNNSSAAVYSGTMYVFCTELLSIDTLSAALSGQKSIADVTTYLTGNKLGTANVAAGLVKNTLAENQFSSESLLAGNNYNFYYVLVDDAAAKYLVSGTKTAQGSELAAGTNIAFGNQLDYTQTAGNWVAVPEPTSGILLLLGMAGLALRRKQK